MIAQVVVLVLAAAIVGLASAFAAVCWKLVQAHRELADLRVRMADARTAAEDNRADVAERQVDAAVEEASEAADTVAAIHEQAARNGGVVDPGALWDAGVHEDGDEGRPRPGAQGAPVSAAGPAAAPEARATGPRPVSGR